MINKEHQIKIRPTRKMIAYIILVVVSLIPAPFINTAYGYLPFLFLLFIALVSFLYIWLLKNHISAEPASAYTECVRGEKLDFKINVKNDSLLVLLTAEMCFYSCEAEQRDITEAILPITIGSRQTQEFDFSVDFAHIGLYGVGIKEFRIYDLLGILRGSTVNERFFPVNVMPHIYNVEKIKLVDKNGAESQNAIIRSQQDGVDYSGVREYEFGDPIKQIHWKLSAHMKGYMTKLMETYTNTGVAIVLDMHSEELSPELMLTMKDCIIEAGYSLNEYARRNGIDNELIYVSRQDEEIHRVAASQDDISIVIDELSLMSSNENEHSVTELLRRMSEEAYSQSNIILCTASLTEDKADALTALKRRQRNPLLIITLPAEMQGGYELREALIPKLNMLSAMEINYYIISEAEELQ